MLGFGKLGWIFIVFESQKGVLQGYQDVVCSGQVVVCVRCFFGLVDEFWNQLDMVKVFQQLGLDVFNGLDFLLQVLFLWRLQVFLGDLLDVQKVLQDVDVLLVLVLLLFQGVCIGWIFGFLVSGVGGVVNGIGVGIVVGFNVIVEEGVFFVVVLVFLDMLQGQCLVFVQFWVGLQFILCGNNCIIEFEVLWWGNMSFLGFMSKEQWNLGFFVYFMISNFKILYVFVGFEVDCVIFKVNEIFVFVGNVIYYVQVWFNILVEICSFLEQGRLQ